MKILIRDGKIIGAATDEYMGPEEYISAPDDFDIQKNDQYQIINAQAVIPATSKLEELAALRYKKETIGIEINGIKILTDRESQGILDSAQRKAERDSNLVIEWKGVNGWFVLDAANIISIGDIVFAYVQACFKREHELEVLLKTDLDTDINVGWPDTVISL